MTGINYIPKIVERLKQGNPDKIILFGSYATGQATEDSDIDIMVVSNDNIIPSSYSEKSKVYLKFARLISDIRKSFPVDLIVHTRAMHQKFIETRSMFAQELQQKGKVLYERNN